ncbi:ABC transporter permease [Cohaesibacter celericrescens]|nr:ABC transporter permease [Cohaesibacter celericrescens]
MRTNFMNKKLSIAWLQYLGLITVILLIIFLTHAVFGNVLTAANMRVMAMNMVFEAIMALGMTFVIILGGIDLSVASVFAFAEILVAKLMMEAGLPVPLAVIITIVACCGIGMINGFMIVAFRVHPMVITLGTLLTLRGINLAITDGRSISGFSDGFHWLGQGKIFGIDFPIVFFVVVAAILGFLLAHHKYFRQIYFIGGSERSARFSGVSISRVKISIYALCATLAGCAGVMAAAKYGAAHWGHGNMAELKAIGSVAIGGADMMGGSGTIFGTVLGAMFLAVVHNAFVTSAVNPFWYDIVNGAMLLIAVLISRFIAKQNDRKMKSVRQQKIEQSLQNQKSVT